MQQISIYGENRHPVPTKTRIACRGVMLSEGELLLSHEEAIDQYMIPGGGLEAGETLEECCAREMAEETGYVVDVGEHYLTIHEYYEQWHLIHHYFLCTSKGVTDRHLTAHEAEVGLEPKWIPLDDAVHTFGSYAEYETDAPMKSGAYLREYTALQALK